MKNLSTLIISLSCVSALCACSSHDDGGPKQIDANKIYSDLNLTPTQKSEKLALAGEQLVTPTGFMYANIVFDQSLEKDPTNKRAQFYKAFLALPLQMHGILARLKPFAYKKAESKKKYDAAVMNLPISGLKTFLFDGSADIKDEKDVQAFLDSVYKVQDIFREFVKANKNLELTLNMNDWSGISSIKSATDNCSVNQVHDGVYDIASCDISHVLQINLNRADMEAFEQIAAGLQIYTAIYTAYDMTGVIAVSDKYQGLAVSNQVVWKELSQNPDFGKVRNSGSVLKAIIGMGVDAVAGVRWASKIQNQLCPKGENALNRPGFLFNKGICISGKTGDGKSLDDLLKTIDLALAGEIIAIQSSHGATIQLKPAAIFNSPILDLKTLQPQFNSCGNVTSVADSSFGGLFPSRDANSVLAKSSECQR